MASTIFRPVLKEDNGGPGNEVGNLALGMTALMTLLCCAIEKWKKT